MDYQQFGGADAGECSLEKARIVILPLCYEHRVSYGTGTGEGPRHILEASSQLEMLDDETFVDWSRLGIHTLAPLTPSADPETAVSEMKAAARQVLDSGRFLLSLGGDHAISIGPILAAATRYESFGVLQVDAHLDLRDTWNGSRWNHACVMRRIHEDLGCPIVQVGIRSISPEEYAYIREKKLQPVYAAEVAGCGSDWIDTVMDRLPDHVYVTIDLDGLDPSVVPGVGTPEPGGLMYRQLIELVKQVGSRRTVVAADINELAKIPGTQVSEFTAAKIASKLFVYASDAGREMLEKSGKDREKNG